jgi:hypothetical protein
VLLLFTEPVIMNNTLPVFVGVIFAVEPNPLIAAVPVAVGDVAIEVPLSKLALPENEQDKPSVQAVPLIVMVLLTSVVTFEPADFVTSPVSTIDVVLEPAGFVASPVRDGLFACGSAPDTVDVARFIVNPAAVEPPVSAPTDVIDVARTLDASVAPVREFAEHVIFGVAKVHPPPSVNVDGATPAPPPFISRPAPSTAVDAIFVELLKYGMPPEFAVPETVVGNDIAGEPPVLMFMDDPFMRAKSPVAVSHISPLFGNDGATPTPMLNPAPPAEDGNRNSEPAIEPPAALSGTNPRTSCLMAK